MQTRTDPPGTNSSPSSPTRKAPSRRSTFISLFGILLVFAVSVAALLPSIRGQMHAYAVSANVAALTYKNDNARTGQYLNETILNTTNVTVSQFGKHVTYPVDGQVYAQPLYVPNLTINGVVHNVVFVATEHDSVYAFDADQTTVQPALWSTSFLTNGATSVPYTAVSCNDLQPEIGITGTPVIDSSTNTMYVVSYTLENGSEVYRLHALDITTGLEQAGSPTVIQASVPGKGSGSVNGNMTLNPLRERERSALLQANGQIYIAFGSFCDNSPYEGWVLGYTYNGTAFQQADVYDVAANGSGGGIWGSGGGVSADSSGNIYIASGNGDFNLNTGGTEAGDSFVKLNANLQVQDYMAPFNQSCLQQRDTDLGSGGPLILSSSNRVIGAGKEGRIYVMDSNNMGKFTADPTLDCTTSERLRTDVDNVVQELPPTTVGGVYSNPAFWNASNGQQYVYFSGSGDHTKAFQFSNGLLSTSPTSQTPESFGFTGGNAIISSNGSTGGTGIVWVVDPHAVLRAYDATNLAKELYNSGQNANRDALDSYVKFSTATVANGEVFVPTADSVTIYGLVTSTAGTPTPQASPTATPPGGVAYNNIGISDDASPTTANFDFGNASYSKQALQATGINPGDNAFYNGMVFTWPDAVAGTPDNYVANGQTVPVNTLANAVTLGFLGSATGGPSSGTATINYTDGTTQPYTLGFSDWTLGGGGGTLAFGNAKAITTTYRNTPTGQQALNTYVFYAETSIPAGKTVQSVTLPATVDQGALHVFAISTKQTSSTPTATPTPTPTPVAVAYNNKGTTDDANTSLGNFDGVNSYSAQALSAVGITAGQPVVFNGVTFTWPNIASGLQNNYKAQGQVIPITPVTGATTLAFLGSSTSGASSGAATITYTDGTTQTFTLGLSDWTLGGGTNHPSFGNQVVATTAYRNTSTGQQSTSQPVILYTDVALQSGKTIQSVTLPTNSQLHIFTIATGIVFPATPTPTPAPTATPTATPTPTATSLAYNNKGTTDDANPSLGNFDGSNSYSAQALSVVGISPGQPVVFNGVTFTWPNIASGLPNNYKAQGQIIPVTPVSGATTLAFLGSSTSGASSGTATITYTDGTTQTFTLGLSDWTLGGGTNQPSFGNQVVATTAYRNTSTGQQLTSQPVILYTDVALQSGKTMQSVTLPTNSQLHVFTLATGIPTVTPTSTPTSTSTPTPTLTPTPLAYDNKGTTDDAAPSLGNFDGSNSYSAQALSVVGISPGQPVAFNGVTFIWPNVAAGLPNNYKAQGQVIPVTSVSGATTLAFLGASTSGASSGTATITYTDGTTQTFTLGLSDWTLGSGTSQPSFGNQVVATTAYRNTSTGPQTTSKPVVLYTDVALQSGKTIQSVTLPVDSQLHVFTIATK